MSRSLEDRVTELISVILKRRRLGYHLEEVIDELADDAANDVFHDDDDLSCDYIATKHDFERAKSDEMDLFDFLWRFLPPAQKRVKRIHHIEERKIKYRTEFGVNVTFKSYYCEGGQREVVEVKTDLKKRILN